MKRGAPFPAAPEPETSRRRRQPQISCSFCRSKKLKCDRAQPCFNCRSRGISCDGQLPASSSRDTSDVLERLRRLEDAVFGPAPASSRPHDSAARPSVSTQDEPPASSLARPVATPHRDRSPELDYNKPGELPVLDDSVNFSFRVASTGEHSGSRHTSTRCIDFPSRDDAASLYHDYLDASDFHVASILHPPSFQTMMSDLYAQLRQGQHVRTGSAALILAVCAAAAFFWDQDLHFLFNFQSEDHAAAQSHSWRSAACDLLDHYQSFTVSSLETIQACLVLADLIYNMEGITSRFRYFHSCARAAAYELRLHLLDLPGLDSTYDLVQREMKRRLWWYMVGTDWLCCTMGGVMGRIYTINPKHMFVNRPHYIPASDEFTNGLWSEPAVVHMTLRIRLADICREIADTLPLGSGDLDTIPYSKVAALDRMFEDILTDMPALDWPIYMTSAISRKLATQRAIGTLSVHARRARLLRPLLQVKNLAPNFQVFRRTCFKSVEAVMDIASRLLSQSVDSPASMDLSGFSNLPERAATMHRSPHRSGLIINHLFMACAVLATDPSLRGDVAGAQLHLDAETEWRRAQVKNACRLLQKAGEKSAMALDMVKRLVSVLRKHQIQGVEELASAASTTLPRSEHQQPPQQQKPQKQQPVFLSDESDMAQAADADSLDPAGKVQQKEEATAPTWGYDAMRPHELTGIWNDFLGTNPTNEGWEQLFTDLDYLSYAM